MRGREKDSSKSSQRWQWLKATLAERMGDPTTKPRSITKSPSASSTPRTSATSTPASTPPRTTRAARRQAQEEELKIENPPSYHYILVQRYTEEQKRVAQLQALERAQAARAAKRAEARRYESSRRRQMSWEEVEEYLRRKLSHSASAILSRASRSFGSMSSKSSVNSRDSFGSNSLADEKEYYHDDDRSVGSQHSLGVLWNHMTCSGKETEVEDWIGIPPPIDESFSEEPPHVESGCGPFRRS